MLLSLNTPALLTRRRFLAGSLAASGAAFANARPSDNAKADACILLFLNGGMSHLDTFDPKPEQPAEIRGEFRTIRTTAPGILVGEHLPMLAAQAHRFAVARSVGFEGKLGNHSPACFAMLTGREPQGEAAVLAEPSRADQPALGSAAAKMRPVPAAIPAYVMVPDVLIENAFLTPGQFAGWLGSRYEAFCVKGDPSLPEFAVQSLTRSEDVPDDRMDRRHDLLNALDARKPALAETLPAKELGPQYERAFDLLSSTRARSAFDMASEPRKVRERYGMNKFGQSVLLARRCVEAGVRFVNVHWPNVGGGRNWDTHRDGFNRLKDSLLPPFDRALSALLDDLADRGRLERTLVIVLTEFGRAPQIGRTFQNSGGPGGRDHWSNCFSIVMAGGGIRGGETHGRSDARGSYPAEKPLTPADVAATVYRLLGIDTATTISDSFGQLHRLCEGKSFL